MLTHNLAHPLPCAWYTHAHIHTPNFWCVLSLSSMIWKSWLEIFQVTLCVCVRKCNISIHRTLIIYQKFTLYWIIMSYNFKILYVCESKFEPLKSAWSLWRLHKLIHHAWKGWIFLKSILKKYPKDRSWFIPIQEHLN